MGQKVNPYGFRLGIIRQPKSSWFAEGKRYREQLQDDLRIRKYLERTQANAGISSIHLDRAADTVTVTIVTAKPGIVIGRGGRDVETLRQKLEEICGQKVRVNVEEVKEPDLDAVLVAQSVAKQIERRISYRRAMRQAVKRAMDRGARGVRCKVSGRLQGAEIARTEAVGPEGRVPLHTLRADIDYGVAEARTGYGHIGVKVWIYKGDILPPKRVKPGDLYTGEEEAASPEAGAPAAPVTPAEATAAVPTEADVIEAAWEEPTAETAPVPEGDPQDAFIAVDPFEEMEGQ